eukprot:Hpha_TRINITY_DN15999_c1_g9::TRINITY_DN15999_c1_g9_i1::g.71311::m.71311
MKRYKGHEVSSDHVVAQVGTVLAGGRHGKIGVDGGEVEHGLRGKDGPKRVEGECVRPDRLHRLDTGVAAVVALRGRLPVVVVSLEQEPRTVSLGITVLQPPQVRRRRRVVRHHRALPWSDPGHDEVPGGDHRLGAHPLHRILECPRSLAHCPSKEGEDPVSPLRGRDCGRKVRPHCPPRVDGYRETTGHHAGPPDAHRTREGGTLVDELSTLRHQRVELQRREWRGVVLVPAVKDSAVGVLGNDGGAGASANTLPLLGERGHGSVDGHLVEHVGEEGVTICHTHSIRHSLHLSLEIVGHHHRVEDLCGNVVVAAR